MGHTDLITKLANIPLPRPGFNSFSMSAPTLIQMNPDGKWESCKPENLDEGRLKSVIQHLVNSKTFVSAQNYCSQCAAESQTEHFCLIVKQKHLMHNYKVESIYHVLLKSARIGLSSASDQYGGSASFRRIHTEPDSPNIFSIFNLKDGCGTSKYVPVIMLPVYSADNCPFNMECEVQKMRKPESNPTNKLKEIELETAIDKDKKKTKKRGFVMQRLTDFDLLSQW